MSKRHYGSEVAELTNERGDGRRVEWRPFRRERHGGFDLNGPWVQSKPQATNDAVAVCSAANVADALGIAGSSSVALANVPNVRESQWP